MFLLFEHFVLALRAVGNVVTGTDEQTQLVLNCGALNYFPKLFQHQRDKLNKVNENEKCRNERKFSSFRFSGSRLVFVEHHGRKSTTSSSGDRRKFDSGSDLSFDERMSNDFLRFQIDSSCFQSEIQTQKEAAWCISNLTMSGNVDQIHYVVDQRVLRALWFVRSFVFIFAMKKSFVFFCFSFLVNFYRVKIYNCYKFVSMQFTIFSNKRHRINSNLFVLKSKNVEVKKNFRSFVFLQSNVTFFFFSLSTKKVWTKSNLYKIIRIETFINNLTKSSNDFSLKMTKRKIYPI